MSIVATLRLTANGDRLHLYGHSIDLSVHRERERERVMASSARKRSGPRKTGGRTAADEGKVRKEFWLDPEALAEAQAFLGTTTERETVEVALELVAFRRDLSAAARALKGLRLTRID
jgi:hypothetical protein